MPKKGVPLPAAPQPAPDFTIVGVGASAGGFEAFAQLLEGLPANPNIALIFVQHLAPHHSSSLAALLASHTSLPVVEATEGARIVANRVYVVPPNAQMEMVDGHLHLGPRPDDRSQYTPIDFFFRSLARTLKSHAVGVVLSGTASDGALGIREIKSMEGITFAQDPSTAKYDGMPRAAIATQMIDVIAPPDVIAAKVTQLSKHPYLAPPAASEPGASVKSEQLQRIFRVLLPACGVNFSHYKTGTIIRRLYRRMALLRMIDVDAYVSYLEQTPAEVVNLHNDLLIHVTRFFREPESFDVIARDVLPSLDLESGKPIRMWVAGCATGEEVYSLAMVVHEVLGEAVDGRVQIFGTDVSDSAVGFARHGLYAASITEDVSPERLRQFFTKTDGGYRVTKPLRDMCVFARQDLTRDPPFSHLDLICCRNVLIYMDSALQRKLLSMFHYALKPSGVLMLGQAESIGYHSDLFAFMNKKNKIYRKKAGTATAPSMDVFRPALKSERAAATVSIAGHSETRLVVNDAHHIIMERYAPPSVLLDQDFHVVQFNGQTGLYLEPSPGEPTFDILKLAREGLSHGLRLGLQAARKLRKPVKQTGLRIRHGALWQSVDIEVIPVVRRAHPYYLVLFQTPRPSA